MPPATDAHPGPAPVPSMTERCSLAPVDGYRAAMQDATPRFIDGHYGSPESARAALVRLEGAGFDADAAELVDLTQSQATREQARENDHEKVSDVARPAGAAATIGAAAGAAAGVVTGLVTGDPGTGAIVGAAAATGGSVVGGLAGTYGGLPVNEAAWDTYELDPSDEHPIVVRVRVLDDDELEKAKQALTAGGRADELHEVDHGDDPAN